MEAGKKEPEPGVFHLLIFSSWQGNQAGFGVGIETRQEKKAAGDYSLAAFFVGENIVQLLLPALMSDIKTYDV